MYILSGSRPPHRLPRWQDRHVHLAHDRYCPCRCGQCAFPNRRMLRHQPIMARQDNLASVEPRQQVPVQIALRLLAQFVADAVLAEWLLHELAAVVVTNNLADAIALEQSGEFVDHGRWRERRPHLADSVHDHSFVRPCGLVRNGQRHGVLAAARRVDEGAIGDARSRQHLAMVADATLDYLERDEALDIGAELGEIFGRRAGAVLLQRAIDDALRQDGLSVRLAP